MPSRAYNSLINEYKAQNRRRLYETFNFNFKLNQHNLICSRI
jgi:hypothetical protein